MGTDKRGGNCFCLDMVQGRGSTAGQVIVFFHDMNDQPMIARAHLARLERLAWGPSRAPTSSIRTRESSSREAVALNQTLQ